MTENKTQSPGDEAKAPDTWRRRIKDRGWRRLMFRCAFPVLLPWGMPLLNWIGLSSWGFGGAQWYDMVPVLMIMLIPIMLIGGAVGVLVPAMQQKALFVLVAAIAAGLSVYLSVPATHAIRRYAFTKLGARSMSIVDAIKQYEKDKGYPPADLRSLVPTYLPEVPKTEMPMYPEYSYSRGSRDDTYPWILSVYSPFGFINFDRFIYLPDEVYPESGWGGSLEPMGRWAYVHE